MNVRDLTENTLNVIAGSGAGLVDKIDLWFKQNNENWDRFNKEQNRCADDRDAAIAEFFKRAVENGSTWHGLLSKDGKSGPLFDLISRFVNSHGTEPVKGIWFEAPKSDGWDDFLTPETNTNPNVSIRT